MVADLPSAIHSTTRQRGREREEEGREKNEGGTKRKEKKEDSARKVWRRKKRATPRHRRFIPEATLEMCSWKSSRGAPAHKPCTRARVRAPHTHTHTQERETHVRLDLCGIGGGAFSRPRFVVQSASSWTRVVSSDFLVFGEWPLCLSRHGAALLRRNKLPNRWMHECIDAFTKKTPTPLFNFYP